MEASAVEATRQLVTRNCVRNFFFLAKTEFKDLDAPPPCQLLRNLGSRLHVFGCAGFARFALGRGLEQWAFEHGASRRELDNCLAPAQRWVLFCRQPRMRVVPVGLARAE